MSLDIKLPEGFRFQEADHSYWMGQQQIPGVTQTIAGAGLYPFATPRDEGPNTAMLRGWAVHLAIDAWYKGELQDIQSELAGYVMSEKTFVEESGFKAQASEVPICNKQLLYGCIPDRLGILNDRLSLIDSKTGGECKAYHVQLVANFFAALSLGLPVEAAYLLELKSNGGRPRLIAMKDAAENWEVFLAALTCAKWRFKNVGCY